jgi:uracil-DNA glycosylase family 4
VNVSNLFPTHPPGACRLALIGEAPGAEEVLSGQPFVGSAGRLLTKVLLSVGLTRAELFIGNVCQTRPPGNDLSAFPWDGEEIQGGIRSLIEDLFVFRPNLIVALGNVPLHLFMAGNVPPKVAKTGFTFPFKISHWRGSLFLSTSLSVTCPSDGLPSPQPPSSPGSSPAPNHPSEVCHHAPGGNGPGASEASNGCGDSLTPVTLPSMKTLATWHPAGVLRELSKAFELRQDLRKAVDEGRTPDLNLPALNLRYGP